MHNKSIIKLIGHRPVYRVERNQFFAPRGLEANAWEHDWNPAGIAPEEQSRPVMDSEDPNPASGSL
jgi:hypothetical protein